MFRATLISATLVASLASTAGAATHVYDLNGSFADSLGGHSLVGLGGSLGSTGYTFGPNQGLTLDLSGILSNAGVYSIEIKFSPEDTLGFRKLIDFSNLTSDLGLYDDDTKVLFVGGGSSPPGAFSNDGTFDLIISRTLAKEVTVSVDGTQYIDFVDSSDLAVFATNTANFFVDDHVTGQGEATGGFVDFIKVSDTTIASSGVPEPMTWELMALGFFGLSFAAHRTRKSAAST